jgi:N-acetylglucosaminyl-diphospho-decaprenol L-rhamnosyltransferase
MGAEVDAPAATRVDVAIVTWNTAEAALAAARAYLASEGVAVRVTIVDNASREEQRGLLRAGCPAGARLIASEENRGYGAAANLALRDGSGELVCVSNADVVPEPTALARLAEALAAEPRAGMVGPVFDGGTNRYHARLPGAATMLGRVLIGSLGRRAVAAPPPGAVSAVGQPSGACFAMRRPTWEEVGGFDEGFFLWYEDVDLAKRLRDAGHRNLVVGSARVAHAGARSFAQLDSRRQQAIRLDSVERYVHKHHPRALPLALPLLALSRRLRADG